MMNYIKQLYLMAAVVRELFSNSIAAHARSGKLIPCSALFAAIVLAVFLFFYRDDFFPQEQSINGIILKKNSYLSRKILRSIRSNGGILVMGTSETQAEMDGENFWGILNRDIDFTSPVTVIAGAGYTFSYRYPFFYNYRNELKGMRIIYYINPVYWSAGKNSFNLSYYARYNHRSSVCSITEKLQETGLSWSVPSEFCKRGYPLEGEKYILRNHLEKKWPGLVFFNQKYEKIDILFQNAVEYASFSASNSYWMLRKSSLRNYPEKIKIPQSVKNDHEHDMKSEVHLEWNVSADYYKKNIEPGKENPSQFYPVIYPGNFMSRSFLGFLDLMNHVEPDILYVIGPYNGIYLLRYNPREAENYRKLTDWIRSSLESRNNYYIDAVDMSYSSGSFTDPQHHSKRAALEVSRRIKKYYEKK